MEGLWRDLRFGCRTLLRDPGFTVAALFTLGLGLGAASAIYTVADAVRAPTRRGTWPPPEPGAIGASLQTPHAESFPAEMGASG